MNPIDPAAQIADLSARLEIVEQCVFALAVLRKGPPADEEHRATLEHLLDDGALSIATRMYPELAAGIDVDQVEPLPQGAIPA